MSWDDWYDLERMANAPSWRDIPQAIVLFVLVHAMIVAALLLIALVFALLTGENILGCDASAEYDPKCDNIYY